MSSHRTKQFNRFAEEVVNHIETYTVKQYGDFPSDQLTEASKEDVVYNIRRYVNRINSGARGRVEAKRDMLKLAHYTQVLYDMMEAEEREAEVFNNDFIKDFKFALERVV